MKYGFFKSLVLLASFVVLFGCTRAEENYGGGRALRVNSVVNGAMLTKTVIDSSAFSQADAQTGIGLYLLSASDGSAYSPSGCSNVWYFNSGDGWNSADPIILSDKDGILYGYFPYDSSLGDFRNMPVSASLNGTDYMYAEPVAGVSFSSPQVDMTMKHALARFSVKFLKDASYSGAGVLSSLSFDGDGVAAEGSLDVVTGIVTAPSAGVVSFSIPASDTARTITSGGLVKECLIVPVSESDTLHTVVLKCVIDDVQWSLTIGGNNGVAVKQGVKSDIAVSVKDNGLELLDVCVGEWGDGAGASAEIDGKRTFTVKMADGVTPHDIMFNASLEGEELVISAVSRLGNPLICFIPEGWKQHFSYNPGTDSYEFRVAFPESAVEDLVASIGYAPEEEAILSRIPQGVKRRDFYKDIFFNVALGQNCPVREFPAYSIFNDFEVEYMYATTNGFAAEDTVSWRKILVGSADRDFNGCLLYPDGEARFRALCWPSGNDIKFVREAGSVLGEDGLNTIRKFVHNGGSYLGLGITGSAFAGRSFGGEEEPDFLALYEGKVAEYINNTYSTWVAYSYVVDATSPWSGTLENGSLVSKNGYTGYLANSGEIPDIQTLITSTSSLMRGKPIVWAYKTSPSGGGLVFCGYPIEYNANSNTTVLKAAASYAVENVGCAKIKAVLHNGETRYMDCGGELPAHCGLGDNQCHNFVFELEKDASSLQVVLDCPGGSDLNLYLKKGSFALPGNEPDYQLIYDKDKGFPMTIELENVPAGLWYVTVQCSAKVTIQSSPGWKGSSSGFYYLYTVSKLCGSGMPYNISVDWNY